MVGPLVRNTRRTGGTTYVSGRRPSYPEGSRGAQLTMKYVHRKSGVLYRRDGGR